MRGQEEAAGANPPPAEQRFTARPPEPNRLWMIYCILLRTHVATFGFFALLAAYFVVRGSFLTVAGTWAVALFVFWTLALPALCATQAALDGIRVTQDQLKWQVYITGASAGAFVFPVRNVTVVRDEVARGRAGRRKRVELVLLSPTGRPILRVGSARDAFGRALCVWDLSKLERALIEAGATSVPPHDRAQTMALDSDSDIDYSRELLARASLRAGFLAVVSFLTFASPAYSIISGGVLPYTPSDPVAPDTFLTVALEFTVLSLLIAGGAISGVRRGLADPSAFSGSDLYGQRIGLRGAGGRAPLGRIRPADVRRATLFLFGRASAKGPDRYGYLQVRGRRSREAVFHAVTAQAWDEVRRMVDDPRVVPSQRAHDVCRLLESRRLDAVAAWLEKNSVRVTVKNAYPDGRG